MGRSSFPALRLNVVEVDDSTIAGIYGSILQIGRLAGVGRRAETLCASMRNELERIRRVTSTLPRRRMLFLVGRTPERIEDLIAAGRSSYLTEVIKIAGGENIFQDSPVAYAKVPVEEVLARKPEVIVDMGEMAQTVGVTQAQKEAVVRLWSRYPFLPAVQQHRVYAVASDIYVVPGPRVVEAAREFARMLHPEAAF